MKWLSDILTEADGNTFCLARVSGFLSVLVFLGNSICVVWLRDGVWDMQSYGIGVGALLGGVGAAISLKTKDTKGGQ